jgi:hypothetical protein
VAHLLIAEDLGCSTKDAHQVMLKSGDAGESLHPDLDDDNELDEIVKGILFQAHNTKVFCIVPCNPPSDSSNNVLPEPECPVCGA